MYEKKPSFFVVNVTHFRINDFGCGCFNLFGIPCPPLINYLTRESVMDGKAGRFTLEKFKKRDTDRLA
ncbi:hypothetical protein DV965_17185, partial [Staphylococcus pseudintermedius]|uniref:hypothetical protein n=1 Tax=Staphylococcus pseudintermedius TaxID=283734 RepID=UPI000E362E02